MPTPFAAARVRDRYFPLTQRRWGRLRLHLTAYWRSRRGLGWHLRCVWQDLLRR